MQAQRRLLHEDGRSGQLQALEAAGPNLSQPSNYFLLRLTPNGMAPVLMASFFYSLLPQLVGWLPGATAILQQTLYRPGLHAFGLGLFVLLGTFLDPNSSNMAQRTADWLGTVRDHYSITPVA